MVTVRGAGHLLPPGGGGGVRGATTPHLVLVVVVTSLPTHIIRRRRELDFVHRYLVFSFPWFSSPYREHVLVISTLKLMLQAVG